MLSVVVMSCTPAFKCFRITLSRDGTGSPGHGSPGQRFWPGRCGSWVSVSDPVFDPVLSFNMRVYRGVVSIQ